MVARVLAELPERKSPWQVAFWFVSTSGWLGGATPAPRLADGDAVVAAALYEPRTSSAPAWGQASTIRPSPRSVGSATKTRVRPLPRSPSSATSPARSAGRQSPSSPHGRLPLELFHGTHLCYAREVQPSVVSWYDSNASRLVAAYEAVPPTATRDWLADLLPSPPAVVIDVGAGTGRDAGAFAAAGYEVIAVEPSSGMRAEAERLHQTPRVRWLSDSLPALTTISRSAITADVVSLSAVWQHVPPADRPRAFRKLVGLLRSGGLLVLTLRHGPDDGRGGHPVSLAEVEALARSHGMQVVRAVPSPDLQGRPEISWTAVVLRLPDDGTGALPLLRHLILMDAKSATYKLGLLRALCRAADGSAGLAQEDGDDRVRLPLGLVALNWLRLYLPLTKVGLPQAPGNRRGAESLGFAGPGWQALEAGALSPLDLRVGAVLGEAAARALQEALREAADHIIRMPANYLTFPGGGRILETTRARATRPSGGVVVDGAYLSAFGTMRVPRHLWTAMQRFAVWVEPALISEWMRLMQGYAATQGRTADPGAMAAAMTWSDPVRDVALPRARALALMKGGTAIYCVWSGKRLTSDTLDVDHCLPWSAWPCGDLWNLMPSHRRVNQHSKRERLPSAEALQQAGPAIADWWSVAYLRPEDQMLPVRFVSEARASLPGVSGADAVSSREVQVAMALQRTRLRQDQGVPEWVWRP
ncbi:methyltransferase domain-containing protein [Siccirubricoccus sp. KC 17139]|uniref:Methyltransferase domain-containing protein n=2 Tax=Siccirubricoccus soli TaxID=2899147 RepID=A0ABT1D1L5_9PROT|nr:methyltransferase domain-containing protein [Siccirubricoccus soli]MCP2681935.1 methyltransferase domain-containing protein [Siccirubricoccus soli]